MRLLSMVGWVSDWEPKVRRGHRFGISKSIVQRKEDLRKYIKIEIGTTDELKFWDDN